MLVAPFLKWVILDYIAPGFIIPVFYSIRLSKISSSGDEREK